LHARILALPICLQKNFTFCGKTIHQFALINGLIFKQNILEKKLCSGSLYLQGLQSIKKGCV
jgi:hypothetical protein